MSICEHGPLGDKGKKRTTKVPDMDGSVLYWCTIKYGMPKLRMVFSSHWQYRVVLRCILYFDKVYTFAWSIHTVAVFLNLPIGSHTFYLHESFNSSRTTFEKVIEFKFPTFLKNAGRIYPFRACKADMIENVHTKYKSLSMAWEHTSQQTSTSTQDV